MQVNGNQQCRQPLTVDAVSKPGSNRLELNYSTLIIRVGNCNKLLFSVLSFHFIFLCICFINSVLYVHVNFYEKNVTYYARFLFEI